TGFSRNATDIAAEQIRNTERNAGTLREMHRMVDQALDILNHATDSFEEFGRLLDATWTLKRRLSPRIATDVVDGVYDRAIGAGAWGGKLLGAGGGGFMLFFA